MWIFKWDDPALNYKIEWCLRNGCGYGIDYRRMCDATSE